MPRRLSPAKRVFIIRAMRITVAPNICVVMAKKDRYTYPSEKNVIGGTPVAR
jgi:hypothetical protein